MIVLDKTLCPHDHRCPLVDICPTGAIGQGADGFPTVDAAACIRCGLCTRKCPRGAMRDEPDELSKA